MYSFEGRVSIADDRVSVRASRAMVEGMPKLCCASTRHTVQKLAPKLELIPTLATWGKVLACC
jgi:hypothetical protein